MIVYLLTAINAIILGVVAYLFYAFRQAVDASGVRQIDDYLHELEGSVSQLTEQFEKTSTKISKDLLRKTTELQALIGECDTKLAQASRIKAIVVAEPVMELPMPARMAAIAGSAPTNGSALPVQATAGSNGAAASPGVPRAASANGASAGVAASAAPAQPNGAAGVLGYPTVPAALAARRMSASELLATKGPGAGNGFQPAVPAAPKAEPVRQAIAWTPAPLPSSATPAFSEPDGDVDEPRPSPPSMAQPNEKYRLIFLLASEGMDTASIAKHTNLTRGEVEMLLDLRRQGKI